MIEIPYAPRPFWKNKIHAALEAHRFAVLVCHRRFGKTVGTVNHMIKMALLNELPAPMYAYIAPFRKQAKKVAWEYLKYYTSVIPGRKLNETDLYVELPSKYRNRPGARIYIVGADNPDNLRGEYYDGVILDEYAQIKPTVFGSVIRPALADRKGWAVFIGTPKGQNQFYEIYQRACADPKWFSFICRVDESGVLSEEEIEDMKKDMTPEQIRQELYCDFTASASNVVIPIDLISESCKRQLTERDVAGQPVVVGVDVARFGDDRTAITVRQGLWVPHHKWFSGLSTMDVADRVMNVIREFKPHATFIDVGAMGAGVIDRLRQLRFPCSEVSFAGSALDSERYANIRAEMYFKAKEWCGAGGALPNIPELKNELSVVEYRFTKSGKIILEPKADIKERTGSSPDLADSFVLTFARPVYITPSNPLDDVVEEYDALGNY